MKTLMKTLLVVFFASACFTAFGQVPNVSGKWKLNEQKSNVEGNMARMASPKISIVQAENSLEYETTRVRQNGEEMVTSEKFTLDGAECVNTARNRTKKSTVTVDQANKSIVIKSTTEMDRNGEKMTFTQVETLKISDDGKTLTIDSRSSSQMGEYHTILVYDKAE